MSIRLDDLTLAYRKAKVDLYYSSSTPLLKIVEYEENLLDNLKRLLSCINSKSDEWIKDSDFLGSWELSPSKIEPHEEHELDDGLIFASPQQHWSQITSDPDKKPIAEFRLMEDCSMDFHVLSSLWMLKVGHLFDQKLSENVYGNRLRRNRHDKINEYALGSFQPYLKPFRDWRDGGVEAIRTALKKDKKIIALTADVTSFYHELNPNFMLDGDFLDLVRVKLNQGNQQHLEHLHFLFITALQEWAERTPLKKGLPVGLPASALVANMALYALDQFVECQIAPIYYGRYVDDILLVMENTNNIKSTVEFWDWIFKRNESNPLCQEIYATSGDIQFKPSYLDKEDKIVFKNKKNKLFILEGMSGLALINAITEQSHKQSSEWRALPEIPESSEAIATDLLKATNQKGEYADSLRKTDSLSLHRAGFALTLRDYEAFERDLTPDDWEQQRHAFFDAIIQHVLTPIKFFELAQYVPRIIRMATICGDFKYLQKILLSIGKLIETVEKSCSFQIKAYENNRLDTAKRWKIALTKIILESIISALPKFDTQQKINEWEKEISHNYLLLCDALWSNTGLAKMLSHDLCESQALQNKLFDYDLAHIPLRVRYLPKEMVSQRGVSNIIANSAHVDVRALGCSDLMSRVTLLNSWLNIEGALPNGLIFPTRPFGLNELYFIVPNPFKREQFESLNKVIFALRGFELDQYKMPQIKGKSLHIPDGEPKNNYTIAVSSLEVGNEVFSASALGRPAPNARQRYQHLNHLINELIARPKGTDYLILPELAIPPQWFMRIALKLRARGISLIAGVEYLDAGENCVHNQVWSALTHDGLGLPSSIIYRQDKQQPAIHEERQLYNIAGVKMTPKTPHKTPYIIQHGDFRFAILICSELTNIHYRAAFRGKIDALFIPQWNPDTDGFNALVESAALDIHAYIIQCNNRLYGDSRIRGPYKDRWKRDVLRVKGGTHDYCITGEIDVLALRQFQSHHRSPTSGYKPVPDGFHDDMDAGRTVLPKG